MVDLFVLKTFIEVARTHSFRLAAERNHITQPAVSQQIKLLEQKFNCTLFERKSKDVALTEAGLILFSYAERMLQQYQEAQDRINEMSNTFQGVIRIATIYSIGLYQLQPLVRRFLKKYPKVKIHLEYAQSPKIYEMVLNRKIDFGFVAYPKKVAGITQSIFATDQLKLVQSREYPTLHKKRVQPQDLNDQKFISFSSDIPTGKAINEFLRKYKTYPNLLHTFENIETLKSALTIGMGFGIVPLSTINHELKDKMLEMINLKALDITRPLGIIHIRGKILTKAMQSFYDIVCPEKKG